MASCVIPFESMLVQRLEVNNQVDNAVDSREYLYKNAQNSNGVGGPLCDNPVPIMQPRSTTLPDPGV
jgi:hypothetical protein